MTTLDSLSKAIYKLRAKLTAQTTVVAELINKTIGDPTDPTKTLGFDLTSATAAKKVTLKSAHTDNRTVTMFDADDTMVGKATTDVLSNKTLSSPVIGHSADVTKRIEFTLSGATANTKMTIISAHTANRTQTLQNATGIIPLQAAAQINSVAADTAAMVVDFNALLVKLRATGVIAP